MSKNTRKQGLHGIGSLRKAFAAQQKNSAEMTEELAGRIKARAEQLTPVRTGAMRDSLSMGKEGERWIIGYTVSYAPMVEFGHRTKNGQMVRGAGSLRRACLRSAQTKAGEHNTRQRKK